MKKFLIECANFVENKDNIWKLFFDGSKCACGTEARIVVRSLDNGAIIMIFKLSFASTNNIAIYMKLSSWVSKEQ